MTHADIFTAETLILVKKLRVRILGYIVFKLMSTDKLHLSIFYQIM